MPKIHSKKVQLPIITERFMISLLRILGSKLNITKKSLNNIEYLFDIIDIKYYTKDVNIYALIQAVKIAVKYRQSTTNFNKDLLLTEIEVSITEQFKEQKENIILPVLANSQNVIQSELDVMNNTIETYLKYSAIIVSKEKMYDILTDLSSGDIVNLQDSVNAYRDIVNSVSEEFRMTDNMSQGNIIHSIDEDYMQFIMEAYDSIKNPRYTLVTGLKMFNELLSEKGGFLTPSYVIIYASINSFKSALLQYCANWIQIYNSDRFLKEFQETGKIPTVLMYSFENTRTENMQRDFTMRTGMNLKDLDDPDDVKKYYKNAYNSTDSIINIATIYGESGTIKVSDIRRQIHALSDTGYKIIAVVIDYLELLKPEDEDMKLENRLKLGYISNSLHVMSITEDILVLTAQQMNRAAETSMSELREKGATNISKSLSRQYIGESYAIDKPVDLSMYIATERSIYDNKLYLTVKRDKCRYKRTDTDYFVHELKNGFYLEPDYNTNKTLSKKAIMPDKSDDITHLDTDPHDVSIREKKDKSTITTDDVIKAMAIKQFIDYADDYYHNFDDLFNNDDILVTPYNYHKFYDYE
jgi:replicative DNA helicase